MRTTMGIENVIAALSFISFVTFLAFRLLHSLALISKVTLVHDFVFDFIGKGRRYRTKESQFSEIPENHKYVIVQHVGPVRIGHNRIQNIRFGCLEDNQFSSVRTSYRFIAYHAPYEQLLHTNRRKLFSHYKKIVCNASQLWYVLRYGQLHSKGFLQDVFLKI